MWLLRVYEKQTKLNKVCRQYVVVMYIKKLCEQGVVVICIKSVLIICGCVCIDKMRVNNMWLLCVVRTKCDGCYVYKKTQLNTVC